MTHEVTAIAPIPSSTKTLPKTSRSFAPIPPCGRRRRRLRCVITERVLRALRRSGRLLFDRVGGREVVDLAFDQELVGDHDRAAVAGVEVGVGEGDVGDAALASVE